jgi:hypothetical protein
MVSSGGAGGLPMPNSPTEWLGLVAAILLIAWVAKKWLDQG